MKLSAILLSSFLVASTLVAGCSSSTSGSGGTPGVFCSTSLLGSQLCYGYTNLNSDQTNAVTSACTQTLQGKIVSSCPSAGIVGCCKSSQGGYNIEECYYADDAGTSSADQDKQACTSSPTNGTWSTSQ
jgi:hypothetical protein